MGNLVNDFEFSEDVYWFCAWFFLLFSQSSISPAHNFLWPQNFILHIYFQKDSQQILAHFWELMQLPDADIAIVLRDLTFLFRLIKIFYWDGKILWEFGMLVNYRNDYYSDCWNFCVCSQKDNLVVFRILRPINYRCKNIKIRWTTILN